MAGAHNILDAVVIGCSSNVSGTGVCVGVGEGVELRNGRGSDVVC